MKLKGILWVACVFVAYTAVGQEKGLQGSWKGDLEMLEQKLPLIFHFELADTVWTGTIDSPAQGAKGIVFSEIKFTPPKVFVEVGQYGISFEGVVGNDTLKGVFVQRGVKFPMDLVKLVNGKDVLSSKPQEPKPPFDYDIIETSFSNLKAGIKLKGIISKPKGLGPFPAVVLVNGSGKQDMDGEFMGHKPFLVMADYLTKNGIAVLRYDERGVGASEGEFEKATSFDFMEDASIALEHLRKYPFVNQLKSGVIGHSEGGMIAWMMGAKGKVPAFIISLAGPAVPISDLMMQQSQDILRSTGASEELIEEQGRINEVIHKAFNETENYGQLITCQVNWKVIGKRNMGPILRTQVNFRIWKGLLDKWSLHGFLHF